eukprot:TRINITY_DN91084_c0_g1_i1.p1 TRINITY_DN91084_c0_g1~~TRINITY_DN91084_c0_g1_i1.p1  ORF type:complete len:425 (+),score=39.51 TRINITY_DN91084_c0_g1_i1:79-1353(+)
MKSLRTSSPYAPAAYRRDVPTTMWIRPVSGPTACCGRQEGDQRRILRRSSLNAVASALVGATVAAAVGKKRGFHKRPGRLAGRRFGLSTLAARPAARSVSRISLCAAYGRSGSDGLRRSSLPVDRWAGGGIAKPNLNSTPEMKNKPVTLQADMPVSDVIRALLCANAVCINRDGDDVFFVRVTTADDSEQVAEATPAAVGEDLCCLSMADLLDAPRNMPLNCLIDDSQEECDLYQTVGDSYTSRSVVSELTSRLPWLVGMLGFLSVSAAILEFYDDILHRHLVIAFYLTALVGCGGNAGSQACAVILQALATGEVVPAVKDIISVMRKELQVSLGIAAILSAGVAGRIFFFGGSIEDAAMIAVAMAITVSFSVVFGAAVPLLLTRAGVDPAKVSGPLLSTTVDIAGVLVACYSAQLLESLGVYK